MTELILHMNNYSITVVIIPNIPNKLEFQFVTQRQIAMQLKLIEI